MSGNEWNGEELQKAVDAAAACLAVELARHYGLIDGNAVDADRCLEILAVGREQGVEPTIDITTQPLMRELAIFANGMIEAGLGA